ncbi:hypothetical protein ACMFMG_007922 [Clarireedia jacksonii]
MVFGEMHACMRLSAASEGGVDIKSIARTGRADCTRLWHFLCLEVLTIRLSWLGYPTVSKAVGVARQAISGREVGCLVRYSENCFFHQKESVKENHGSLINIYREEAISV